MAESGLGRTYCCKWKSNVIPLATGAVSFVQYDNDEAVAIKYFAKGTIRVKKREKKRALF